jgi:hypothetical protein
VSAAMRRNALALAMAAAAAAVTENTMNSCPAWDRLHDVARRVDWELLSIWMKASGAKHLAFGR